MGARRGGRFRLFMGAVVAVSLLSACGASPLESKTPAPSPPEHVTLQTLAEAELEPTTLELHEVVVQNEHFTTTAVTYSSGGLSVSGALSVPAADGPHPGLVLELAG